MVDKLRKELRIVTNGYKYKIQGREKIFYSGASGTVSLATTDLTHRKKPRPR